EKFSTTTNKATTTATTERKQSANLHYEARNALNANNTPVISARTMKCWENAKSESFYARDNVTNFINWTRALGVRDAVSFETEDLVLHNNPRNVVLCLLEVARIACNKYNFSPSPGLVQFEKEIDEELEREAANGKCGENSHVNTKENKDEFIYLRNRENDSSIVTSGEEELDGWSSVSRDNFGRTPSVTSVSSTSVGSSTETPVAIYGNESAKVSQLDHKVMLIAKSYYGRKAKHGVQRLAEGKYRIAGKIVFVRLLKDKHVMVRVGGGWDTLQHFLERHGGDAPPQEISPSDLLPMDTRPAESTSRRRSSQSSLQSIPTTPVLRRCTSSTPVSRSNVSSPEPWMSGSSGYSSASGSGAKVPGRPLSRRGSICAPSLEKSQLPLEQHRRRSFALNGNSHRNLGNRASINLPLDKHTEALVATAPPSPTRPASAAGRISRYPNYLQSSQHITSKNSRNVTTTRNAVVRRTSLKAF
ncbi:growth arrest-specific protein 2-like protein, partial [Dinothrombium tinctorium]